MKEQPKQINTESKPNHRRSIPRKLLAGVASVALLGAGAGLASETIVSQGRQINSLEQNVRSLNQSENDRAQEAVLNYQQANQQAEEFTQLFNSNPESTVTVTILNGVLEPLGKNGKPADPRAMAYIEAPIILSTVSGSKPDRNGDFLVDGYIGMQSTAADGSFEVIVQSVERGEYEFVPYNNKNFVLSVGLHSQGGKGAPGNIEGLSLYAFGITKGEGLTTQMGQHYSPDFK